LAKKAHYDDSVKRKLRILDQMHELDKQRGQAKLGAIAIENMNSSNAKRAARNRSEVAYLA